MCTVVALIFLGRRKGSPIYMRWAPTVNYNFIKTQLGQRSGFNGFTYRTWMDSLTGGWVTTQTSASIQSPRPS